MTESVNVRPRKGDWLRREHQGNRGNNAAASDGACPLLSAGPPRKAFPYESAGRKGPAPPLGTRCSWLNLGFWDFRFEDEKAGQEKRCVPFPLPPPGLSPPDEDCSDDNTYDSADQIPAPRPQPALLEVRLRQAVVSQIKLLLGHVAAGDLERYQGFALVLVIGRPRRPCDLRCYRHFSNDLSMLQDRCQHKGMLVDDVVRSGPILSENPLPCRITHQETVGEAILDLFNGVVNQILEFDAYELLGSRPNGVHTLDRERVALDDAKERLGPKTIGCQSHGTRRLLLFCDSCVDGWIDANL